MRGLARLVSIGVLAGGMSAGCTSLTPDACMASSADGSTDAGDPRVP